MRLRGAVLWISVGASVGAALVASCVFCCCASQCWTAARAKTTAGPAPKRKGEEEEEPGWRRIDADSDDFYDLRDGGTLAVEAPSSDEEDDGSRAACRPGAVAPAEVIAAAAAASPAPSRRPSRRLSRRLSSMSALLSESMYAVAASLRSKPQFHTGWSPSEGADVEAEPEAPSTAVPRPDVRGPVAIILHATMRHLLPTSATQRQAARTLAGRSLSSLYAASPAPVATAYPVCQEVEEVRLAGGDVDEDDVEQPSPALGRYDRLQIRTVYTNAAL
jgi:hypothetical protein